MNGYIRPRDHHAPDVPLTPLALMRAREDMQWGTGIVTEDFSHPAHRREGHFGTLQDVR